ncbi:hypothetical protein [Desulfocurvus vexinensis]|uniref:hypothetical protein n=1 Tax=Desulfocurvus vexinensis TaxID=399548 RepID=UPI0004AE3450|nr:hypothetical protein [Desulfocurvus vexinensis]
MPSVLRAALACVFALSVLLAQAGGARGQQPPAAEPAPPAPVPALSLPAPPAPAPALPAPPAPGFAAPPAAGLPVPQGPYQEQSPAGVIDWEAGTVTARGQGVAPAGVDGQEQAQALARRAATMTARRSLFGLLCDMQIDSASTVCMAMNADGRVAARVQGLVQNSHLVDAAPLPDGPVVVTVDLGLRGALADALLPPASRFGARAGAAAQAQPAPGAAPAPGAEPGATPGPEADAPPAEPMAPYTGLVVDARGLGARPALVPRLVDGQGRELYGPGSVSRELAVGSGLAVYVRDPGTAVAHSRVAGNPLVLRARAASGPGRTDLVLPDEAAEGLLALPEAARLLAQARVLLVLD